MMERRIARSVEGGAIGVALWCLLFTLQILPGVVADTPGLAAFAVLGILAGAAGLRPVLMGVLSTVAVIVAAVALSPLSETLASRWVRQDRLPARGVDAVVVPSGGLNPDTTISSDALDRLLSGLELAARVHASVLVTTRTLTIFPSGAVSSDSDQSRIVSLARPALRWIRVPGGHSTRDEAVATSTVLDRQGVHDIAVVTSPMHTRRACAAFEAVGFRVTCSPARMRAPGGRPLSPTAQDRFAVFGQWVYEVAADAKYRSEGWVRPSAQNGH